jgi:uncharacterized protein (TIGR02466 family)
MEVKTVALPPAQRHLVDALPAPKRGIKAGVMPLFSTWVYHCREGPVHLNECLVSLIRSLREDQSNEVRRTNCSGWDHTLNFFEFHDSIVTEFRSQIEQHVQAFLNHFRRAEHKKRDRFRLRGWIKVDHPSDFDVLHCHPGSFLSGVYYLEVPHDLKGGDIIFRDPRGPLVAMYETPGIDLPWPGSVMDIPFSPATGHLLIFPAWLEHRIEPFRGTGERISIAFNASNPDPSRNGER